MLMISININSYRINLTLFPPKSITKWLRKSTCSEAVARGCSVKKVLLKISQNS